MLLFYSIISNVLWWELQTTASCRMEVQILVKVLDQRSSSLLNDLTVEHML